MEAETLTALTESQSSQSSQMKMLEACRPKRLLFLSFLFTALILVRWAFLEQVDVLLFDLALRIRGQQPADPRITIVAIDDRSLREIGRWPWSAEVVGNLFKKITDNNPAVLGVDLLLSLPLTRYPQSLQAAPVVLATALGRSVLEKREYLFWQDPEGIQNDLGPPMGHIHAGQDVDGVCRSIPLVVKHAGKQRWAFALEIGRVFLDIPESEMVFEGDFLRLGTLRVPRLTSPIVEQLDSQGVLSSPAGDQLIVNFRGGAGTFPQISASQLLAGDEQVLRDLHQKIVLVGATSYTLGDHLSTPFTESGEMPGVEIHANAVDTILNGRFITPLGEEGVIILLLIVLVWSWCLFDDWSRNWGGYLYVGTLLAVCVTPLVFMLWLSVWIPLGSLAVAVVAAGAGRQFVRLVSLNRLLNDRFVQLSRLLPRRAKDGGTVVISQVNSAFRGVSLEWKLSLLSQATESALRTAQIKEEMLSFVTHELKTPLTSIGGFADLLLDWDRLSTEDRLTSLQLIREETERLSKMVDDYLGLTRLESGARALEIEPCRVDELLARACALLAPQLSARRIKIARAEDSLPTMIAGDCDLLTQVFINLLGNAVKYSPLDTTISVSVKRKDGAAEISVQDEGYGIPERDQSKVFEKFFRATQPGGDTSPGSGLGLAFVKEVVEQHGGQVSVESTFGQGSVFRVLLTLL